MAEFNKNDLAEFIKDSISGTGSISPTIIKDIQTIIKRQIEMNDADTSIKALADDIDGIKTLFEGILNDMKEGKKSSFDTEKIEGTFKDVLSQQIENNEKNATIFGKFYDGINKFLGSRVGGSLYDALNMITDGHLGVIRSMTDNAVRIGDTVKHLYSGISDQVDYVFEKEKKNLVDPAVKVVKGVGAAAGVGAFKTKEEKRDRVAKDSKEYLEDIRDDQRMILGLEEQNKLLNLRQRKTDIMRVIQKIFSNILMGMGATVGLILGGAAGIVKTHFMALLAPFKLLSMGVNGLVRTFTTATSLMGLILRPFKTITSIISSFSNIPGMDKAGGAFGKIKVFLDYLSNIPKNIMNEGILGRVTRGLGSVMEFFKRVGEGVGFFGKVFKILKPMIDGFKFVFVKALRIFGWPLTILMGVIDFVKGFMKTEGTIGEKIIGGLKAAIMGIVEMPLKIIGWAIDKLTGGEGMGDKLVKGFKESLDKLLPILVDSIVIIFDSLKDMFGSVIDMLKGIFNFFVGIAKFFIGLSTMDGPMMKEAIKEMWDGITKFFTGIGEFFISLIDMVRDLLRKIPGMSSVLGSKEGDETKRQEKIAKVKENLANIDEERKQSGLTSRKLTTEEKEQKRAEYQKEIADLETSGKKEEEKKKVVPKTTGPGLLEKISKATGSENQFSNLTVPSSGKKESVSGPGVIADAKQQLSNLRSSQPASEGGGAGSLGKGNTQYDATIKEMADKYGVKPDLVKAVMKTESGFNPNAQSPTGPKGLMQLSGAAAKDMGVRNVWNPRENIEGGTKFLSSKLKEFGGDETLALTAYNQGSGTVRKNLRANQGQLNLSQMTPEAQTYAKKVRKNMPVEHLSTTPLPLQNVVDQNEAAKVDVVNKQMEQTGSISESITKMGGDISKGNERPIVLNAGGEADRRQFDPPSDVESMSIMWLNKSWGLG